MPPKRADDVHASVPATQDLGPKKRPWYKKKRFMIPAGMVLLVVLVQSVNGGSDQKSSGEPSNASAASGASTEKTKTNQTPALGTPVRDGKFEFVASKMTCGIQQVGGDFLSEKAQGQFCALSVTAKNIGNEPQQFFTSNQEAFSGSIKYSSSATAALYYATEKGLDSGNWAKEINPGNQLSAVVMFDIPVDQKIDKVKLHDSAFSRGVEVTVS
ncbi:MAG: DUF4352 domain-containing protein [Dermatophilaceae bacterium]